jgi:hypothetical protein
MIGWNEYHVQMLKRIGEIAHISPDIVCGYRTISEV